MTDYKNIRVSKEAWHYANEAKHDDETWSDYVLRCGDIGLTEDDVREIVREMVTAEGLADEYRDLKD